MKKLSFIVIILYSVFFTSCNEDEGTPSGGNDAVDLTGLPNQVILDWNLAVVEAMGGETYQHSLLASRISAMTHIAMHDALNAIAPLYKTYAFQGSDPEADPIAATAVAAHAVLSASFPDQQALLDAKLTASLAGIEEGTGKTRGLALGKEAAAAILALRQDDGAFQDPIAAVPVSDVPGVYQAVPPFDFVFAPHWRTMLPFALEKPEQFRIEPPVSLDSEVYAEDFNEVKTVGEINSATRTPDQTAYAKFWYEFSEMGWNRVTRVVAVEQKLDLPKTARLFALVNMAMADAYTAGWDSKFYYDFWRPYTAIRAAEADGNPYTTADADWEPAQPTPPVQDYPSTHSALGNAAATVLAYVLGNNTAFTLTSSTAPQGNAQRSFSSFSEAADENADSRVMAGIHFRFSCTAGQTLGTQIGQWVVENQLRPLEQQVK